jgi:hypothetical protein
MKTISKIHILPLAKIVAIFQAIFGLISGFFIFIINIIEHYIAPTQSTIELFVYGFVSILVFPIVYGILGFVIGAAIAYIYNFLTKKIGGIKVEITD